MKLTTSCQVCGTILSVVEKDMVTQDDINNYQQNSSCSVTTNGTVDGQTNIESIATND